MKDGDAELAVSKGGAFLKTVVIIQARMGSTRLPGKVMKPLAGRTVLSHVIERVKACPEVDEMVVATTTFPEDDVVVAEAVGCGVKVHRGSKNDVLSRYYGAAEEAKADVVIRVTSDCPLFDPLVLSRMISIFQSEYAGADTIDYLSNSLKRTFPLGLDAEIFTFSALQRAHEGATKDYEREHVTPYIYQHPEIFRLKNFASDKDLSFYRWTLDTAEDYELLSIIYDQLGQGKGIFATDEVLELFGKRPELIQINAHVHQKKLGE